MAKVFSALCLLLLVVACAPTVTTSQRVGILLDSDMAAKPAEKAAEILKLIEGKPLPLMVHLIAEKTAATTSSSTKKTEMSSFSVEQAQKDGKPIHVLKRVTDGSALVEQAGSQAEFDRAAAEKLEALVTDAAAQIK